MNNPDLHRLLRFGRWSKVRRGRLIAIIVAVAAMAGGLCFVNALLSKYVHAMLSDLIKLSALGAVFGFMAGYSRLLDRGRGWFRQAPGAHLSKLLSVLLTRKAFERVYEPQIVDMRMEHAEALAQNRPSLARWIHIRGIAIMLFTFLAHAVVTVGKAASRIWVSVR